MVDFPIALRFTVWHRACARDRNVPHISSGVSTCYILAQNRK
jgi:hypothetical protein